MTVRFYIMPKTGDGLARETAFRPKYHADISADGARWSGMDWPGWYLVKVDGSDSLHTTLDGYTDTLQSPVDLTGTITAGAQLTNVQNKLESVNIPADWVTAGMTWKQALKGVAQICQFWQRVKRTDLFDGRSMSTTWAELPQSIKDRMQAAGDSWGMDKSSLSSSSTLRQILRAMAIQFPNRIVMNGEDLEG